MAIATQTVREIALERPASVRVFEKFGIDYCCGGHRPLESACAEKGVPLENVLGALQSLTSEASSAAKDWSNSTLAALCKHIVSTHHAYVRRELPRLQQLAEKVVDRHGPLHEELPLVQATLADLDTELVQHLGKEEGVLFPYITRLENALITGSALPQAHFPSVAMPIAVMTREHDTAGALMAKVRQLSRDFQLPEGACPTYHAFYDGLHEFELDLHQHIHLENNLLFPRAIAMEASINSGIA